MEGGEFNLHIIEFINLPAENERLNKSIDKIQREQHGLISKINNRKFLDNAPKDLVNETQERIIEINKELLKLSAAQKRLINAG